MFTFGALLEKDTQQGQKPRLESAGARGRVLSAWGLSGWLGVRLCLFRHSAVARAVGVEELCFCVYNMPSVLSFSFPS